VSIDLQTLKSERDKLKESLRVLEGEQRKLESELKLLRQREIRTKREIEALSTLVELNESRPATSDESAPKAEASSAT
jgi:predicted  nucleic acid-binding Zn-ribbon protein